MVTWGVTNTCINIVHQCPGLGLGLHSPINTKALKGTGASRRGEFEDQTAPSISDERDDLVRETPTVVKRFRDSGLSR